MKASESEIKEWLQDAKEDGFDYVIVVTDTFSYEDYPVFANESTKGELEAKYRGASMQRVSQVLKV